MFLAPHVSGNVCESVTDIENRMNTKAREGQTTNVTAEPKLSFSGGGKVSVSVNSIVSSANVQRQVKCVKEIAAHQLVNKRK